MCPQKRHRDTPLLFLLGGAGIHAGGHPVDTLPGAARGVAAAPGAVWEEREGGSVKIKPPGIGPQVLVHVSTYRVPFTVHSFVPQPCEDRSQSWAGEVFCKRLFGTSEERGSRRVLFFVFGW